MLSFETFSLELLEVPAHSMFCRDAATILGGDSDLLVKRGIGCSHLSLGESPVASVILKFVNTEIKWPINTLLSGWQATAYLCLLMF